MTDGDESEFLESLSMDELKLYMCLFLPLLQVYNSGEEKTQMLIGKNIQNVYTYDKKVQV